MKFIPKKIIFSVIIGAVGFSVFLNHLSIANQMSRLIKLSEERYPGDSIFQEFTYGLFVFNIPLGRFVFKVEEESDSTGRAIYLLNGSLRPWNFLNKISGDRMGLSLISRLDHASLLPYSFEQTTPLAIRKGKRGRVIDYYHGELFMTRKNQELDIQDDTKDPLATIFWLMRRDYEDQKIIKSTLNINPRVYWVIGRAHSKGELIRVNAKILKVNQGYETLRVNPAEIYLIKRGEWYLPLWLTMEVMHIKIHMKIL